MRKGGKKLKYKNNAGYGTFNVRHYPQTLRVPLFHKEKDMGVTMYCDFVIALCNKTVPMHDGEWAFCYLCHLIQLHYLNATICKLSASLNYSLKRSTNFPALVLSILLN